MQLVAYGAQDVYLTGSPQITFFKTIYRRHTSFSVESIEQTFNGTVQWGRKVSATLSRSGDLVTDVILEITLKKDTSTGGTYYPAEALIEEVELEIGGQRIDKHYSDWFRVYDSLFRKNEERVQYRRMTDFVDGEADDTVKRFYLPLIFFFNRSPGMALPLIALQYHEVKLNIQLASSVHGIQSGGINDPLNVQMYVDYVYLDTDERRRFAQVSHEYLIQQLQFTGDEAIKLEENTAVTKNIRLNLNHPTRFLAWVIKGPRHGQYSGAPVSDYANIGNYAEALAPLKSAKLQLNGHDRFSERRGSYFNLVQPWQATRARAPAGVYMYSFSLKPDEHQPSGTCNFSRIDTATLSLTTKAAKHRGNLVTNVLSEDDTTFATTDLTAIKVFAENFNVFRIMSGMGGLAYSN